MAHILASNLDDVLPVTIAAALLLCGVFVSPAVPDASRPPMPPASARHTAPAGDRQATSPDAQQAPDGQKPPDTHDAKEPPTPPHTGLHALLKGLAEDVAHLPAKENAYIALAGGAGALAVHPADQSFNARLRSHYDAVNDVFAPGKWVGQTPVQMGAAVATYAIGRLEDQPKASHLGMDLLRAQIINEALTDVLKFATRRERPDHSDALSFPSGHSSITFATATVIERHLGWRHAAFAYAIASYVAASRLHDNRHYLSDVVFGAAVGTISGRTVTQHGRNTWTLAPVNVPGGVALMAMKTR